MIEFLVIGRNHQIAARMNEGRRLLEKRWEREQPPPRRFSRQARIAELEQLVEELLADDAVGLAIENDLTR